MRARAEAEEGEVTEEGWLGSEDGGMGRGSAADALSVNPSVNGSAALIAARFIVDRTKSTSTSCLPPVPAADCMLGATVVDPDGAGEPGRAPTGVAVRL